MRRRGALVLVVLLLAALGCTPVGDGSGSGPRAVQPSLTDPALPDDPLEPNLWIAPKGTPKGKLAVLFNGTGAGPSVLTNLGTTLADDGFHVVILRYESAVGTQAACPDSVAATFPDCHRAFRGEVVFGSAVANHPAVSVDTARSVRNRLDAMVSYLAGRYPLDGWDLDWSDRVLVGHSQGAGVALYLSKFFAVERVVLLSGTYDVFGSIPTVAPWITEGGFATPSSRIGWFAHLSDPGLPLQRAVAQAVGVTGSEVAVASGAPYGGSRRLVTSAQPGCPFDSSPTHNSTATNLCSSSALHPPAWRYLASGS